MAKITFKQSEVDVLFGEKVLVVDGNTRRVTNADILQKMNLPGDLEVEVLPEEDTEEDFE